MPCRKAQLTVQRQLTVERQKRFFFLVLSPCLFRLDQAGTLRLITSTGVVYVVDSELQRIWTEPSGLYC